MPAAVPSVRAISAIFGNAVQVGMPMVAALFGEAGLAIHIALVSLHALTMLTVLTALVELDLARERQRVRDMRHTPRRDAAHDRAQHHHHPVVLPVLAGLPGTCRPPLPAVADEILQTLGEAVVPLCLVLIGMSLAYYGMQRRGRGAIVLSVSSCWCCPRSCW